MAFENSFFFFFFAWEHHSLKLDKEFATGREVYNANLKANFLYEIVGGIKGDEEGIRLLTVGFCRAL